MAGPWPRIVAIVAALFLLLASCGDDDSEEASPPTSDPGSEQSEPDAESSADADTSAEGDADEPTADPAGPSLREPAEALEASLSCPDERQHAEVPGVLLVPGTGLGSEENWALTLGAALPGAGFDVCTVDLVDDATGDITRSAEHVVAGIRAMVASGYDEIAVVGFSQGVLASRWALVWWPDLREPVVDLVGIAGPSGGAAATAPLCGETPCAAALWQMSPGSDFLRALDEAWHQVDDVPVTLIASESDTVVSVDEVDAVEGVSLVVVQNLCPGRSVDHVEMAADAVVFAVVLEAIGADGSVAGEGVDPDCDAGDIALDGWDSEAVNDAAFSVILAAEAVDAEPPLPEYVND